MIAFCRNHSPTRLWHRQFFWHLQGFSNVTIARLVPAPASGGAFPALPEPAGTVL